MVNGRPIEDELERIDEFFNEITDEEFEDLAIECGIKTILPREQSGYVKATQ